MVDALEDVPEKGEHDGKAFDFSDVKATAIAAASGVFSTDRIRLIWETLRALRKATAGAAPPIMVYAAP